ncbi:Topless-related protein 4 [Camellia lanceoleosa]|uniref:Topless-related protein 4 n=1 Tax=Camellia lanceoleosa TaxID=1840588 RepID=A0ACC0FD36_9ERIC|nr:Topless-related protein 4 [Camellia lanceoleosa]
MLILVWDVATGSKQYIFEGHQLPVYSVCPHTKENIQFIFSTGIDGKIKAWLYDNLGSRVDYDAPGHSCTTMAYSADGTRLFSCGTSKEGESYIVEWNESEGAVKRTYHGLGKCTLAYLLFLAGALLLEEWRMREATLYGLASLSDQLLEAEVSQHTRTNLGNLFEQIIAKDVGTGVHEYPFLFARVFSSIAKFSSVISRGVVEHFLYAAIKAIGMDVPPPVKVGACRALSQLLPDANKGMLQPHIMGLFSSLADLLNQVMHRYNSSFYCRSYASNT